MPRLFLCWVWTKTPTKTSPRAPALSGGPETAAARTGVRPQEAGGGSTTWWLEAKMVKSNWEKDSGAPGSEMFSATGWPGCGGRGLWGDGRGFRWSTNMGSPG